jgi:COP9 signalosome complex subunit 2
MCSLTKDTKRLKRIYPETNNLNAVINDPRIMGIIKENGGKMFLDEKNW